MSTIMKFMAKSKSFHEFLFDSTIVNEIEPIDRWKSQTTGNNDESVLGMTQQLFSAQASASVERIIVIIGQFTYCLFSKLKQNAQFKVKFAY